MGGSEINNPRSSGGWGGRGGGGEGGQKFFWHMGGVRI